MNKLTIKDLIVGNTYLWRPPWATVTYYIKYVGKVPEEKYNKKDLHDVCFLYGVSQIKGHTLCYELNTILNGLTPVSELAYNSLFRKEND